MNDIQKMLERQAQWQKRRKDLAWPEKIRLAERVRESARQLRASARLELREPLDQFRSNRRGGT